MKKSGYGGYKKLSAAVGFNSAIDTFTNLYSSVLSIAGTDLIFFGIPERATTVSGKVSKWTSFSSLLTSSTNLYFEQVTDASRPALNGNTSAPYQTIGNTSGTYLTTKSPQGTFGNVNLTTVSNLSVCTFMKINVTDGAASYPILFETGDGGTGGAYVSTLGALELQLVAPTTVPSGVFQFALKRGHTIGQYQIVTYDVSNTGNYLRTSFNHFVFYYKAARDDSNGNSFGLTINKSDQSLTSKIFNPANPSLANNVTNFNNIPMHWGSSYNFSPSPCDYSSLIIIGRQLTVAEKEKIYNIQRAIGDILQ